MKNQKHSTIPQSEEQRLEEIRMLSENAKKISGEQKSLFEGIDLGDEDIDTSYNQETLNDTADPDKSHRLYYTMMAVMKRNLPQGEANKPLRRYIYDEKSLFLNRGKDKDANGRKNSDERQAYIGNFLEVAFNIVNRWVAQGASPFDLYKAFYDLNKERGYREPQPETSFDSLLKATLTVPTPKKDS